MGLSRSSVVLGHSACEVSLRDIICDNKSPQKNRSNCRGLHNRHIECQGAGDIACRIDFFSEERLSSGDRESGITVRRRPPPPAWRPKTTADVSPSGCAPLRGRGSFLAPMFSVRLHSK
ncbi:hypothetical protein EVAR_35340_1 [Eumeta japonica]|uniref:Uncharacterized protein n=1 Tax=Eumeta variegata TaxID=151549 RepID=A0A4C1XK10_EUMVA|nr:hypothetical protein EVAR_35340_1 [Eumeta japonica]